MQKTKTEILHSFLPKKEQQTEYSVHLINSSKHLQIKEDDHINIGRSSKCTLPLDDPFVSYKHCSIYAHKGLLRIKDLHSSNGTFLNGVRIKFAHLHPAATIRVGNSQLRISKDSKTNKGNPPFRMIGESPAMLRAIEMARKCSSTNSNILILGETGTGKELIARLIHELSNRKQGPFIPINCGAIPRELIGSELFGHERGAFTGALEQRIGVFEQSKEGTLFLDEIGELPLEQQPHLLRVLESRTIRRLGGISDHTVNSRVVAATNRNQCLTNEQWNNNQARDKNPIRLDLYHRLSTVVIHLPPLRERKEDIPSLVKFFIKELAPQYGQKQILPSTMRELLYYSWPGNVRELKNAIERAMIFCDSTLNIEDILGHQNFLTHKLNTQTKLSAHQQIERKEMSDAIKKMGSLRKAAELVKVPKSTFCEKAKRYGLTNHKTAPVS